MTDKDKILEELCYPGSRCCWHNSWCDVGPIYLENTRWEIPALIYKMALDELFEEGLLNSEKSTEKKLGTVYTLKTAREIANEG